VKDSDVRGLVLQKLYELRHEEDLIPLPDNFELSGLDMSKPSNLKMVGNIAKHLDDMGLIKFSQHMGHDYRSGYGAISAYGVDVVEGNQAPPISITVDSSVNVHGSQGVQIGGQGNVQTVTLDVEKLINAVDGGHGTMQEKAEAKSLLKKLTENPIVKGALDFWVKSHTGA
jgi:hypothetical protein